MSSLESEPSPLVYTQDEELVLLVAEPLDLNELSRVVVAKADKIYAETLRRIWAEAFPGTPVDVCHSGQALLAALREQRTDFVVMGLTFSDLDGLDVLDANAQEQLARRVFVVTSRKDEHALRGLRAARFDGLFDPEEEGGETLTAALKQVVGGRGYISPGLCHRLVERRSGGVLAQRLTPTELMMLAVIGDGTDDDEAGRRLGLTRATVQSHRRNLMRKLDVPNSAKLVREALRLGVVRILPDGEIVRPGFTWMLAEWKTRRKNRGEATG